MSSNTLRGIGKKGADAEATGGAAADGKSVDKLAERLGKIAEKRERQDEKRADGGGLPFASAAKATEAAVMPAPVAPAMRSLDSTIPGTRSLDASVPGAAPSLDAQFSRMTPPLSATLIGIPTSQFNAIRSKLAGTPATAAPAAAAPSSALGPHDSMATTVGRRDLGTVSGHDVHLPQELQRAAGVHATSGGGLSDGTPSVIVGPGLTGEITDSVAAPPEMGDGALRSNDDLALGAHMPWYDQLPAAEEVYEDAKPNLVARIAVGAAAAAAAAVLVIAFVRMHGQDATPGATAADTPPAVTAPRVPGPAARPAPVPAPPAVAPPAPAVAAAPPAPPPAPAAPVAVAPPAPVAAAPTPIAAAPAARPAPKAAPLAPVVAAPPAPTPPPPAVAAAKPAAPAPTPPAIVAKAAAPVAVAPRPAALAEKPAPRTVPAEQPAPPKPIAMAPRSQVKPAPVPAAHAGPAVALRTDTAAPARAAAPRPTAAVSPAAPKPARPATQTAPARKAPMVAAATPSGPARSTAGKRSDAPGATPKRSGERSRQKLLTDPDSTLPLSLD